MDAFKRLSAIAAGKALRETERRRVVALAKANAEKCWFKHEKFISRPEFLEEVYRVTFYEAITGELIRNFAKEDARICEYQLDERLSYYAPNLCPRSTRISL